MKKTKFAIILSSLALAFGAITFAIPKQEEKVAFATYTNHDADTYYSTIDASKSGNDLLKDLRTLNLAKRQSTVGYSAMGTSPSGQFKYTDYDPNYVQYDSNGQPYGTRISSFYTYTSATSFNREHVWPNSHGGGSGGDAGSPYPDADIHMPRPTISSENSSRGNSFFVEEMNHSSNGWDPYTAGYSAESRGEAARITFYCTLVNSKLILAPSNTTPSGTDSVTGQSFGSGHTMGNLETLIKWNINYPVNQRERNRNEGAEYLQGNRNPFVDHPDYACRIWGNVNDNIRTMCANASWDVGAYVSISKTSASILVDGTDTLSATASDNSQITWSSDDLTVAEISKSTSASGESVTITGVGPGTAKITATANINNAVYSASCNVTVSSSGGGGGGGQTSSDEYTITYSDLPGSYPTSVTERTAASGIKYYVYNVMNQNSKIQFKKSGGYLYNSESLDLNSLTLNSVSGDLDVYAGTSRNPTATEITGSNGVYDLSGYNYFKIINATSSVASCSSITVTLNQGTTPEKTLSSISLSSPKTAYTVGDSFVKPAVTAHYSDNTEADVTSSTTFSGYNMSVAGDYTVTASYTEGGVTETEDYEITVSAAPVTLSSIAVSNPKTDYTVGDTFVKPTVMATFSDNSQVDVTNSAVFSGYNLNTAGNQTVSVSYTYNTVEKTTSYQITVTSSGGGQGESGSQRIVSKSGSAYYQTGSIYMTGSNSVATSECDAFTATWNKNGGSNGIAYTYDEIRVYASHSFTISPKEGYTISSVVLTANNSTYANAVGGSSLNNCSKSVNNMIVTLTPNDGSSAVGFTNTAQSRINYITVNYQYSGSTAGPKLTSIDVNSEDGDVSFIVGDEFTHNGVIITAYYDDDTEKDISNDPSVTFSGYDMSVSDAYTVTVSYTEGNVTETNTYIIGVFPRGLYAYVSKDFYVGDIITKDDILVMDHAGREITDFEFTDYQFKYEDAASGGALTEKVLKDAVTYLDMTGDVTVNVQRKAKEASDTTYSSITYTDLPTTYQTGSTIYTAASGIKFQAYNCANYSGKMQFKASTGYLQNTEPLDLVCLTIHNRENNILTVYGSNTAGSFTTTINGVEDVYDLTGYKYFKVSRNSSGAAYCSDLEIGLGGSETAINVSNYIMYEDTVNQCTTKLDTAIGYLNKLNETELNKFATSSDYIILSARTRLDAWAASKGKTIDYSTANHVSYNAIVNPNEEVVESDSMLLIVVIASLSTVICFSALVFKKKRK